jgi:hypothetical protein
LEVTSAARRLGCHDWLADPCRRLDWKHGTRADGQAAAAPALSSRFDSVACTLRPTSPNTQLLQAIKALESRAVACACTCLVLGAGHAKTKNLNPSNLMI